MDAQLAESEVVRVLVWRNDEQTIEKEYPDRRGANFAVTQYKSSAEKGRLGAGRFVIEADIIDRETKVFHRHLDRVEYNTKSVTPPTPDKTTLALIETARQVCAGKAPMGRLARALSAYDTSVNPVAQAAE